jgi:hypothetical protein
MLSCILNGKGVMYEFVEWVVKKKMEILQFFSFSPGIQLGRGAFVSVDSWQAIST